MTKDELKAIRHALRLNAADFGARVGVSGRAVEKWEQGVRKIPRPVEMLINLLKENTMTTRDQNGNIVTKSVRKEKNGWSATVWFGGAMGPATNVRRYLYSTKRQAYNSDVSDTIGVNGKIGVVDED